MAGRAKKKVSKQGMSRRTFLKITGLAGGAVLGAGAVSKLGGVSIPFTRPLGSGSAAGVMATEEWKPTTCWIGKQDCSMLAHVVDGRIVKFEGIEDNPRNKGTLCVKGMAQIMAIYDPYRVKAPLRRTNAKGVPGEWEEVSWDTALKLVADKMNEALQQDPRLLIWQKGRSKAKNFYDHAFVHASGATKLHHGAFCSDAGYRACEYTIGMHGVLHPDFRYCRYLISLGWNITNAGGNKFCWIVWPREFVQARERGMKVVHLDPHRRNAGPFVDEWIPIRPGTDMLFFLAVANELVSKGHVDTEHLLKYTNAPFLVKSDGLILRDDEGKELVWDTGTNSARAYDEADVTPALEGEYNVNGESVKTGYTLFKEHVAQYTPAMAEKVTDVPASTITRIADELWSNAMVGSYISIDGETYPYRPVAFMGYHVAQQEHGFQMVRSALIVSMLLGAIYTPGGLRINYKPDFYKNYSKIDTMSVKDPPYNLYLKDSKYYPINSNNSSLVAHVMLDPEKYGVDYKAEDMVMIIHMTNMAISYPDQPTIHRFLKKLKFVAVVDPWMSETADYFADVVLPAATIEKYEGPLSVNDQYDYAKALRIPPIPPLYKTRGDIDIYLDLCEKAGILDKYITEINKELKLTGTNYELDTGKRPTVEDIFDRWAKNAGYEEDGVTGLEYFKKRGVSTPAPYSASTLYPYGASPAFAAKRNRLYGEALKRLQDEMKAKGADRIYWQDYTPFPTWRTPTMDTSPPEYEFYLVGRKKIEFKQSRSTFIPLLNELEHHQVVEMNADKAKEMGITDGDEVIVESINPLTKETRQVKARALLSECIRPDTVCMPHHYGFWVHPRVKDSGPTSNTLYFTGEGHVSMSADQSFQVKVKIRRG